MKLSGGTVIAIDVGATKVAAGVVDRSGRVHERVQEPLERRGGQPAMRQVLGLAQHFARRTEAGGVGVAVPGVVDAARREVIWAPNIRGWRRIRLAEAVEEALRLPTWLEYDGHAAVLGEHWVGAGQGVRNLVMLVVGTGIGGGMILDGRLYRGADQLAGAAGWLTSGACVTNGCTERQKPTLEMAAGGPALAQRGRATDGRAESVVVAARAGDGVAQEALDDTADRLGLAVADVVSLLNPDLVVLGGGVCSGEAGPGLLSRIRRVVRDRAQPVAGRRARIVRARLGVNAGLVGAAHAAFMALENEGRL